MTNKCQIVPMTPFRPVLVHFIIIIITIITFIITPWIQGVKWVAYLHSFTAVFSLLLFIPFVSPLFPLILSLPLCHVYLHLLPFMHTPHCTLLTTLSHHCLFSSVCASRWQSRNGCWVLTDSLTNMHSPCLLSVCPPLPSNYIWALLSA